jgi:hypothetical protein
MAEGGSPPPAWAAGGQGIDQLGGSINRGNTSKAGSPSSVTPSDDLGASRERFLGRPALMAARREQVSGDLFSDTDPDRVLLTCDAPDGVMRPCSCGSILFAVEPGAGPHAAQLRCDFCGCGGRWLSRAALDEASS